ncbi:sensor histidine kinase [Kordiimonas sp. SCSIO 12610]|uniref:sensor histidine kinase n=1 Tax=Kordiimonas sp. SCSIO 12610 TaxID=2829597 RepID=UPI00210DAD7B|nr:histidine kinase [Kordiimonas sp. SCSIO 12610]UTW54993.1 histidine kinase [Kordiimonas sp. SCSIO 12610]
MSISSPHTDREQAQVRAGGISLLDTIFADRNKAFWLFQCSGWLGYILVRVFHSLTAISSFDEFGFNFPIVLPVAIIGILLTCILRIVYRRVRDSSVVITFVIAILSCALLGLLLSSIEAFIAPYLIPDFGFATGFAQFNNAMFQSTVLFAWSSIYFGYHYYTGFLEQQERALKATAMAHQAQLKMLRYQLNPHFLFNTLNAISTLVLEKAGDDANKMLTKLSSFLRYTLVNQPTQRTSLEQELQATSLYLDIEAVRFGERLKIVLDIDDKAKSALVPSLILQPLVENAIKYAIAPEIDGGTIRICAHVMGRRLMLMLEDTGPGIPDVNNIVSQSGSGVGIVNTKDRLTQIYGETHELTLKNLEPSGLGITIAIPLEHSSRNSL